MDIRLLQSRHILLRLLEKRGYDVDKYKNHSINEIRIMNENDLLDMLLKKKDNDDICFVKYHIKNKLKSTDLHKYVAAYFDDAENRVLTKKTDELLIICNNELLLSNKYSNFKDKLKNYYNIHNYFIQLFSFDSLMFDITQHQMVPEHIIINDDEKKHLLEKYKTTEDKLPHISRFDPIAKVLGLRPGTVCKIIRSSYTSGVSTYYRICV